MESKNSGERASGVRNHTRLCLGLFVRRHSGLKEFAGIREIRLPDLRDEMPTVTGAARWALPVWHVMSISWLDSYGSGTNRATSVATSTGDRPQGGDCPASP